MKRTHDKTIEQRHVTFYRTQKLLGTQHSVQVIIIITWRHRQLSATVREESQQYNQYQLSFLFQFY